MLNDIFRIYKKIIVLILLLMCAILFWFFACHDQSGKRNLSSVWEEETYSEGTGIRYRFDTGDYAGTVTFGAKGRIPAGRVCPVVLNIISEKEDFEGLLRITLPGDDGNGIMYQSPVRCSSDEHSEVITFVPELGTASCFSFEIVDSLGTVRLSKVIVPEWSRKEDGQKISYIGVLCDNPRKLSYIDGLDDEEGDEAGSIHTVFYLKGDFPQSASMLSPLSGILIDDFDTSSLSDKQLACLLDYVKEGGALLLATGESGQKSLSGISEEFGIRDGEKHVEVVDFSGILSSASRLNMTTDAVTFEDKDQWEISDISETDIAASRRYGLGKTAYVGFSFSDKSFTSWSNAGDVVCGILKEFMEPLQDPREEDSLLLGKWYLERALFSFLPSMVPDTFQYGIYFLFYLLILVFVAYYLLKQLKKRELIWLIVPVLAVAFTAFISYRSTGLSKPDARGLAAVKIADTASLEDEYYLLYRNGEGESYKMDLDKAVTRAEPFDYEYRTDIGEAMNAAYGKIDYTILKKKDIYEVLFSDAVPGTSRILRMTAEKGMESPHFEMDLDIEDTTFSGTLTNTSRHDYSKTIVIRGRQFVAAGPVKAGQSIQINRDMVRCLSSYEDDEYSLLDTSEDTSEGNLLLYAEKLYTEDSKDLDRTTVIGIDDSSFPFLSDGNVLKNHISMEIVRFEDEKKTEHTRYITDINKFCLRSDEDGALIYDTLESFKTKGTYQFGRNQVLNRLCRNRDSFTGKIYAHNYQSGGEDRILESWDDSLEGPDLLPYLSDQNVMILTYRLSDGEGYGTAPILSASIKEKGR